MIIESCHELVPPEEIKPITEKIINNYITEYCQNQHITVGLNTIREILARMPLALDEAQIEYLVEFRNYKIIYRRYAGLYFCICVDVADNNLFYLEAIHNFVEVLNEYFHNVCELDLVFNFYKVYTIVDEMFLAGELRETSQTKVLKQLLMLNSLE